MKVRINLNIYVVKTKITLLSTFASIIVVSFFILVSCQKENKSLQSTENLIESRLKMKPLVNSDKTSALEGIVSSVKQGGVYYSSVIEKLDMSSAKVFFNEAEGKYIAFFSFQNDTTKTYSVYGYNLANKYVTEGEVLTAKEINSDGSYTKFVVKNQEAFKAIANNNTKPIYQELNAVPTDKWEIILTTDCQGRHGGTGFCQREPGESFGACHRAEVDEFTDDFVGWLFYKANEAIVDAMIAAACACGATQCPK